MKAGLCLLLALAAVVAAPAAQASADCVIKVGVVMELTGPAGTYGRAAAKAAEMALRDLNDAGGVCGCKLVAEIRDSQSSAAVAVDVATQLVQLSQVRVLIGGTIASVTVPILTAVTAPAKVVQISPSASSPTLTALGRAGKTNGMFFRTITSDSLQGAVAAEYALAQGFKRMAILTVNNDFGVNLAAEFRRAYQALGGTVLSLTAYNENQPSYRAEATQALSGDPDALYLVGTPVDGANLARSWISAGGVAKFLLNDGMNSADFIKGVGAKYLDQAYGTSSGTSPSDSTRYFNDNFQAFAGIDPATPAADRAYDAAALAGLAIAAANNDPSAIRAAIYRVVDAKGTPIHAGKAEFARALTLIEQGKPIRYEGVIGAIAFDDYGDIAGPFRLWKIDHGQVVTTGDRTVGDVARLKARIGG